MNKRFLLLFISIFTAVSCNQNTPKEIVKGSDSLLTSIKDSTLKEGEMNFEEMTETFESPERENWQKPQVVISKLGDISEKTVVDLGAGTGYFTFRLAEKAKKVIALDIDQRFLDYINGKIKSGKKDLEQVVETRLAKTDDPNLKKDEADIVFIVNTYHHIENRVEYFKNLREILPKGGKVVNVDFKKEELPVGPPMSEKLSADDVVAELKAAGFQTITTDMKSLPYQYIIIAE